MGVVVYGQWSSSATIVPNAPMVVSETIDGESIIMHHGSGHYFNTIGTGALIWEAIERGATLENAATRLEAASGIDRTEALTVVARFLDTLARHDLVKAGDGLAESLPAPAPIAFAEPELGVHSDLADMLLLDPVHDVDEGGWPMPGPAQDHGASWTA